ncbi:hypothetical protein [Reichenbachiella ulvae]|uniref:DKNYY family protein n=1 Tax=Reichenbachiella ulvae TaxID=2980104 RepID=A0ABT3CXV8_9BACT|nr:hypothetical protein [Reichenbachiella ulvae]MCV9388388.1 hypothetical protein [Reichenbachiella ulvae]
MRLLSLMFICTSFSSWAQDSFNKSEVFEAKEIYFYGCNFDFVELAEPRKFEEPHRAAVYGWENFFMMKKSPYILADRMSKKKFHFRTTNSAARISNIDPDSVITFFKEVTPNETLLKEVKGLNIDETDGLGLILFVDYFETRKEESLVHYVFFDIRSREVLWLESLITHAMGGGRIVSEWGYALDHNFNYFIDKLYYPQNKKHTRKTRKNG